MKTLMVSKSRWAMLWLIGALVAALPARAGDGQVLHVGETTTLQIDGQAWVLDKAASRQPHLVSVTRAGASGASQRYVLRGLKAGQVKLVFRSGQKTFQAHIDVLK